MVSKLLNYGATFPFQTRRVWCTNGPGSYFIYVFLLIAFVSNVLLRKVQRVVFSISDTCAVCVVMLTFMIFLLQERSGNNSFTHDALTLKYKLDNEFELLFVVSVLICNITWNKKKRSGKTTFTWHMVLDVKYK